VQNAQAIWSVLCKFTYCCCFRVRLNQRLVPLRNNHSVYSAGQQVTRNGDNFVTILPTNAVQLASYGCFFIHRSTGKRRHTYYLQDKPEFNVIQFLYTQQKLFLYAVVAVYLYLCLYKALNMQSLKYAKNFYDQNHYNIIIDYSVISWPKVTRADLM
jgi:hypothetical protein